MNTYPPLHPGLADFARIRRNRWLYIDKTIVFRDLLATNPPPAAGAVPELSNTHQILVRPRRFGKSLLLSTLEAWFQGLPPERRERLDPDAPAFTGRRAGWTNPAWLWDGLDAADWHGTHGWHPVVRLDMSRRTPDNPADMHTALQSQMMQLVDLWLHRGVPREAFWNPPLRDDQPGDTLGNHHGAAPVVLVDEYDAPVTHYLERSTDPAPALNALGELYGVLKDDAGVLYGVLVTGTTRFAKPLLFTAAGNFTDISEHSGLSALCGFTESEVAAALRPHRAALRALEPGFDEARMLDDWRELYYGYRFAPDADAACVHNPFALIRGLEHALHDPSVRAAAANGQWLSAWGKTCPALFRQSADVHPDEPDGLQRPDFVHVMQDLGYYTWHGGGERGEPYLNFPNRETARSWGSTCLGEQGAAAFGQTPTKAFTAN